MLVQAAAQQLPRESVSSTSPELQMSIDLWILMSLMDAVRIANVH